MKTDANTTWYHRISKIKIGKRAERSFPHFIIAEKVSIKTATNESVNHWQEGNMKAWKIRRLELDGLHSRSRQMEILPATDLEFVDDSSALSLRGTTARSPDCLAWASDSLKKCSTVGRNFEWLEYSTYCCKISQRKLLVNYIYDSARLVRVQVITKNIFMLDDVLSTASVGHVHGTCGASNPEKYKGSWKHIYHSTLKTSSPSDMKHPQ